MFEDRAMKTLFSVLTCLFLITACGNKNESQVLVDKCIEDGGKSEGCTCVINLFEKNLSKKDFQELLKAAQSSKNANIDLYRLLGNAEKKLQAEMETLPKSEQISKSLEIVEEMAICDQKL